MCQHSHATSVCFHPRPSKFSLSNLDMGSLTRATILVGTCSLHVYVDRITRQTPCIQFWTGCVSTRHVLSFHDCLAQLCCVCREEVGGGAEGWGVSGFMWAGVRVHEDRSLQPTLACWSGYQHSCRSSACMARRRRHFVIIELSWRTLKNICQLGKDQK